MATLIQTPERIGVTRFGLLQSFPPSTDIDHHIWYEGGEFVSEPCRLPSVTPEAPCVPTIKSTAFEAVGPTVPVAGFLVEVGVTCSSLPASVDVKAEAERVLAEGAGIRVEENYQARLAAAATGLPGPSSALCAYSVLAEALGSVPGPGAGTIHVPIGVAVQLLALPSLFTIQGDRLIDRLGNIVVIGRGYAGSTIYGEAPTAITIYRDEVTLLTDEDALARFNDRNARAEQRFLVVSDPCQIWSIEVSPC